MNCELLEPLVPPLLEFLGVAMSREGGSPPSGQEKMTAAVDILHCTLEIAGVPLPSRNHLEHFVQSAANKMESEERRSGVCRPDVGEIVQPTG